MSNFYNFIVSKHYHAVMQLDPDQDIQSGYRLFTWYDVCCIIGGISSGGGGIMSY